MDNLISAERIPTKDVYSANKEPFSREEGGKEGFNLKVKRANARSGNAETENRFNILYM